MCWSQENDPSSSLSGRDLRTWSQAQEEQDKIWAVSESRLRIAVWHNLPAGGARRSLVAHVHGLRERGHHIEIWGPPADDRNQLMPFDDNVPQHTVPLAENRLGQESYKSRIVRYLTQQEYAVKAMQTHSQLCADEILAVGFDVLYATNCQQFSVPLIGRYASGPKLLLLQDPIRHLHEAGKHFIWRAPTAPPPGTTLRGRLSAKFRDYVTIRDARTLAELEYQDVAAFDTLLVNSYFSRESMLRAYNIDCKVCYLGVDTDVFRTEPLKKDPYVIGLGSISPGKNIEFIVRSLATIERRRPKLVWVGQFALPGYQATVSSLARELGVELELRVEVSDDELVLLLGKATAFVYAPRLEPFGFAPLEANACGTVAIGVREGGVRESIVDGVNGFLVPSDPVLFGAKISLLVEDPELAGAMGRQAADHVRANWTWARSVDFLERELCALVGTALRADR
jgi:glycosyltransferase involved in cell wall biosynthesis